jgi:hypothetical protein
LPAAEPRELSARGIVEATYNESPGMHIQKINNWITDFNSNREHQIKGIPFRKVGPGNKANLIHYKTVDQKTFK